MSAATANKLEASMIQQTNSDASAETLSLTALMMRLRLAAETHR